MAHVPAGPAGQERADGDEQPVDRVIAAVFAAIDAGRDVDPREWVERYPEFAPELEEFFADLETVGERLRKPGPPDPIVTASAAPRERGDGGPPADPADGPPHPGRVPPASALAFGRGYTLLKRIGGGGQGEVWKAFQSNPDRLVAIKVVRGGYLASPEDVRRFRDETEIVSRLDHPHVVPIYEVGEHQGHHYFSMKLMAGGSLAQRLLSYRERPGEAADLIITIAESVQHAHTHGVIHRDLKPSNILFDAEGRPYLTDFGLAKRFGGDVEATESGSIVGTAAYMSPEQASGRRGVVTTASDVYGLGATLYALLAGRPPFAGDSVLEILDRVREFPPVPLSRLNPAVPRDLAAVCMKCLEKAPARRYPNALKLAEDLRHWRQGEPTVARPVGPLGRLGKWCRRRPGLAAALAAVVLVAALGVAGIAWQLRATRAALASEARTNYFNRIALAAQEWSDHNFGRAAELLNGCDAGQRGWEWYHLMGLRDRPPLRFKAHDGAVYGVVFSPDGRSLASAGGDSTVKLWDAVTGRLVRTFGGAGGHTDTARGVAFSPDGRFLASAGWDGTVRVWDVARGRPAYRPLVGHLGRVIGVAFSPDGRSLASAGDDGLVRVWEAATGRPLRAWSGRAGVLLGVAYSPDGGRVAAASDNGFVNVWDAGDGRLLLAARVEVESARGVAFSPDGCRLALAGGDGRIVVVDARTGRTVLTTLGRHTDSVRGVAYSPRGGRIASAGGDGTVKFWDPATGQEAITLRAGRDAVVRGVAFSPDTDPGRLAAAYDDGTVCVWEAPRVSPAWGAVRVIRAHPGVVYGVRFGHDGRRVFSAGGDRTIRVWDVSTGRPALGPLVAHAGQVYTLALSPDRKTLASAGADKVVRVWEAETGRLVRTLAAEHKDDVWALSFSPDGRLASADGVGVVKIWDVASGRGGSIHTIPAHNWEVWCVAFSRDGRRLGVGGTGGSVKVWDAGAQLPAPDLAWEKPKGHDGNVYGLAFSPDGRHIATAGGDHTIRTWGARTGEPGPTFTGPDRSDGVAYSPNGAYLAAVFGDGTVKVWENGSASAEPVVVLYGHTGRVLALDFRGDGRRLVTAGFDGTARVWDTTGWARPRGHIAGANGR